MAVIGSLTVKLGLVTVEWDKATAKAKQEAKNLQQAFKNLGVDMTSLQTLFRNLGGAAGLSVGGLVAMTSAIMDMASKMQDLTDATGVSEGKVLQFQKALAMAGGKAEDAGTILGTLFTKISAARDGNDVAIAQFEALGISFQELKTATPDEVIQRVYKGLSKISDSFERVRVTKELLGKAGLGKSITEIADALGKSTKKFDEQAAVLQRWDKMADALEKTYANLKMAIAELLVPFTSEKVIRVEQFKAALIAITAATVVGGIFQLVAAFRALNTALKGTAALSVAITSLKGGKGVAMGLGALAAYAGAMTAFNQEDEEEEQKTQPKPDGTDSATSPGGKEGGNAAMQQRARLQLLRDQIKYAQLRNDLAKEFLYTNEWVQKKAESIVQKEQEQAQALVERNQALAKENLTLEQRGLIQEEYNLKIEKADSDNKDRIALLDAQREKAYKLMMLETDQIKARNHLTLTGLLVEEQRRNNTEAETQRLTAQIGLEQKLLGINQAQARYEAENKGNVKSQEYREQMRRFMEQRNQANKEYESQVKIINREEEVRLSLLRQELAYQEKRNGLLIQAAELQNKARNMSEFDVRRAQEGIDLMQKLRDIEQQREALRTNRQDSASEEYQNEMQRLNNIESIARAEAKIRLEGIAMDEQEAMSWSAGWEAALRDFAKNAQRYGDVARNMFDSVVGNMNSAIDNFVRTGKLSFKDLAASIIQDLIAIQLKAQATFLLAQALKGFGFGMPSVPGAAGGATILKDSPYMVGENGPELFVPHQSGTIIPNQRLGEAAGMGGQTINYNGPYIQNMSAIDTQTASQFLAKNRMAVWSANQSATRSLPQSR